MVARFWEMVFRGVFVVGWGISDRLIEAEMALIERELIDDHVAMAVIFVVRLDELRCVEE